MALIACNDVSFAYEGNTAVSGLEFEVNPGDCLCIFGENGSGKSTLVKGLLGLLAPASGKIITDSGLGVGSIGYLPQQTPAQKDFPSSAFEVVLSGRLSSLGMRPFYSRADRAMASENMERLKVADLKNRCYRELSGGQRQRVLIARALCAAGKLLVLDEPAGGLDPMATAELYGLVASLVGDESLTIVMVSHDIDNALKCASHVLFLAGRQIFFGDRQEYENHWAGQGLAGFAGGKK